MLAKRIIPCLDVKNGQVVKGINFEGLREVGDPVEMGAFYSFQGADELVYLDISASSEGRRTFTELVSRIAERIDIPFTVGGGISSFEDAARLLDAGADKITVNTAAVLHPEIISRIASRYGSQFVVVAIDARTAAPEDAASTLRRARCIAGLATGASTGSATAVFPVAEQSLLTKEPASPVAEQSLLTKEPASPVAESASPVAELVEATSMTGNPYWQVMTHGGKVQTDKELYSWAKEVQNLGAGEILFTSMDHDGTRSGYAVQAYSRLAEELTIPVIASGGAGSVSDIEEVLTAGRADAALAASIFHYGEISIPDLKRTLRSHGVNVRI